jgi:uncharacterized protein YbjT (DUF2867 family)
MRNKILITGSTGNVGYPLIQNFPDKARLRAATINPARDPAKLGEEIECVYFDFADASTYGPALGDVQKIFLLRPPQITDVKNTFVPFIEAARQAGVQHIVFLSLVGVEKNRVVPHAKIEDALRASGIPWTMLRASFFMQNLNTTHRQEIKEQNEIAVPVGKGKTSFVDTRDLAAVAAKALLEDGHEYQNYTLTGAEALDYYEVAEIFSEVLGREIRYTNPSLFRFWRMARRRGTPRGFVLVMIALYTLTRFGMAKEISPQLGQLLGRPPTSLRQYVEDYRESWL